MADKQGGKRQGSGRKPTHPSKWRNLYLFKHLIEAAKAEVRRRNESLPKGARKWSLNRAVNEALAAWLGVDEKPGEKS
jgi:transposase